MMSTVDDGPESVSEEAQPERKPRYGLLITLVVALAAVLIVRTFIGQIFVIPSGSMEPTLNPGNRVVVQKIGYNASTIQRGDIVVFDGTGSFIGYYQPSALERVTDWFGVSHSKRFFVKRVIGLPGDHIQCCDVQGHLLINDKPLDESAILGKGVLASDMSFNVVVPAGHLWMMGDNRMYSADSRAHLGDPGGGFVPESKVVGRVVAVIWPPSQIHTVKPGEPR